MRQYLNFSRGYTKYNLKQNFNNALQKIEVFLFCFLSILFIIISKVNRNFQNNVSLFFVEISTPIVQIVASPANYLIKLNHNFQNLINAKNENLALKEENDKLKQLYFWAVNAEKENENLKLISAFLSPKFSKIATAKVIGATNPAFSQNIFLNLESSKNQIIINDVVTGSISMIGRVVAINQNKAVVMLVNDQKSHLPIITANSRVRAILSGNNSSVMRLLYLPKNHKIKIGEYVFSSGDGNSTPAGMMLGIVVSSSPNLVEVAMIEDASNIDIAGIIRSSHALFQSNEEAVDNAISSNKLNLEQGVIGNNILLNNQKLPPNLPPNSEQKQEEVQQNFEQKSVDQKTSPQQLPQQQVINNKIEEKQVNNNLSQENLIKQDNAHLQENKQNISQNIQEKKSIKQNDININKNVLPSNNLEEKKVMDNKENNKDNIQKTGQEATNSAVHPLMQKENILQN